MKRSPEALSVPSGCTGVRNSPKCLLVQASKRVPFGQNSRFYAIFVLNVSHLETWTIIAFNQSYSSSGGGEKKHETNDPENHERIA